MRNGRENVDLGTFDFTSGKQVLYIVKAIGKRSGKVTFAGKMTANGGGPTVKIEDAQQFPSKEQALDVAAEIERALMGFVTVTVEEA